MDIRFIGDKVILDTNFYAFVVDKDKKDKVEKILKNKIDENILKELKSIGVEIRIKEKIIYNEFI